MKETYYSSMGVTASVEVVMNVVGSTVWTVVWVVGSSMSRQEQISEV
jgi:hypothetical protein